MASKSNSNGHVNGNGAMEVDGQDEDKRTRFRRVYMETLVKGFGKDLEKIREVCPFSLPVSCSHPPFFTQISVAWIDADDRRIPHSDLVECNYSSILYQPVSPQYGGREYADDKVRRYMNMESMVKMEWMRLA
jgi:hypothetical protein